MTLRRIADATPRNPVDVARSSDARIYPGAVLGPESTHEGCLVTRVQYLGAGFGYRVHWTNDAEGTSGTFMTRGRDR